MYVFVSELDGEKVRERVVFLFRKFIDFVVVDYGLSYMLEEVVWLVFGQDEVLFEIFVDEFMKIVMSYGLQDELIESVLLIMVGIGMIMLCGKVLLRFRKVLNCLLL